MKIKICQSKFFTKKYFSFSNIFFYYFVLVVISWMDTTVIKLNEFLKDYFIQTKSKSSLTCDKGVTVTTPNQSFISLINNKMISDIRDDFYCLATSNLLIKHVIE